MTMISGIPEITSYWEFSPLWCLIEKVFQSMWVEGTWPNILG